MGLIAVRILRSFGNHPRHGGNMLSRIHFPHRFFYVGVTLSTVPYAILTYYFYEEHKINATVVLLSAALMFLLILLLRRACNNSDTDEYLVTIMSVAHADEMETIPHAHVQRIAREQFSEAAINESLERLIRSKKLNRTGHGSNVTYHVLVG
jgi:hypothetical protein